MAQTPDWLNPHSSKSEMIKLTQLKILEKQDILMFVKEKLGLEQERMTEISIGIESICVNW